MPNQPSILIVDDANVCSSLSKILVKKGYDTTNAENGKLAI